MQRVLILGRQSPVIDDLGALGGWLTVGTIAVLEEGARPQPGHQEVLFDRIGAHVDSINPHQPAEHGEGEADQGDDEDVGEGTGHRNVEGRMRNAE